MTNLKEAVSKRIMKEIILPLKKEGDWKVLILDRMSMRMISACCKMHEIMSNNITLVESIYKKREPLCLEAIYLLTPCQESINFLISDFSTGHGQYRAAHVFFTEACSDELFGELSHSKCAKFIKSLKEVNISFVPYESQVYSLDCSENFEDYMNSFSNKSLHRSRSIFSLSQCFRPGQVSSFKNPHMERIAEQIATLCSTLDEYPLIRYHTFCEKNAQFAHILEEKLKQYKVDQSSMGEGLSKDRSILLIVERAIDPISPLLHELTLQAMAYDLLSIDNDVYKFVDRGASGEEREIVLEESMPLWSELRHMHIANVSQQVTAKLKLFQKEKRLTAGEASSLRDLQYTMKKAPQHRKELQMYTMNFLLAEECMRAYTGYVDKLCRVEQDLAMGSDAEGTPIRDHMRNIVPILLDEKVSTLDKIRIILLFVINNGGITAENLTKLIQHAQIPDEDKVIIYNCKHLGVKIVSLEDGQKNTQPYLTVNRRKRADEPRYQMSRWTPYLKDIMEDIVNDKLDLKEFPFLGGMPQRKAAGGSAPISARYGQWHQPGSISRTANRSRIIIFIVGGVTYSEMRVAYEVTRATTTHNWEILIGGTHVITPEVFLRDLQGFSAV